MEFEMHWEDVEEIAEHLEENYSDEDIEGLKLSEVEEMVRSLSDFEDHDEEVSRERLKEVVEAWLKIRSEL
jgi:FeS assembly protein IscX